LEANASSPLTSQKTFGHGAIAVAAPMPFRALLSKISPAIWVKPIRSTLQAAKFFQFTLAPLVAQPCKPIVSGNQCTSAGSGADFAQVRHQHARRETPACPRTDPRA